MFSFVQGKDGPLFNLKHSIGALGKCLVSLHYSVLHQLNFDLSSQHFLAEVRVIPEPCPPFPVQLECDFPQEASRFCA